MKNFKMLVELDEDTVVFETAKSKKEVDKLMAAYTSDRKARSVRVYERDRESGGYVLVNSIKRKDENNNRPIGFGRWE